MNTHVLEYDIVVVGGGTAGPMAAIKAKERNPELKVLDSRPCDARTVHA
jgi:succinate dehydrogenase/fumarate reductase flavoprotein subunit